MTTITLIAADLIAISVLTFALYFRRHRRRDLVVAFLGVNVGVLAVALVLGAATTSSLGLGLGLFGVLSIIRLRSTEISQREVAYYFAALALGLIAGISSAPLIGAGLMALIVGALWAGDHPALLGQARQQTVTLDRAITDESELRNELTNLLGGHIDQVTVNSIDLVRDLTVVDVRLHYPTRKSIESSRSAKSSSSIKSSKSAKSLAAEPHAATPRPSAASHASAEFHPSANSRASAEPRPSAASHASAEPHLAANSHPAESHPTESHPTESPTTEPGEGRPTTSTQELQTAGR